MSSCYATGQTICLDDNGNVIDCTSAICPGQDGFYQTGCPPEGRYVDNGDGTVTDTCTGLMWQQDTADANDDSQRDLLDRIDWCSALAYCENLELGGHDDWRLPNVRQLHSIIDSGRSGPSADPVFGVSPTKPAYWSSTSFVGLPSRVAWDVDFGGGTVDGELKSVLRFVRAVRTAP